MRCDLSSQVCLVTGAARGIGQAIANRYAASGARVVFTDILPEVEQSAAAVGGRAFAMDVTNAEQIEDVIKKTVAEFGRLDLLVNNAGVNTLANRVTIDEFPRWEWDRIVS